MAFNWQTLRTRTLTAALFVIVMLTGLLWNRWSFLILFSVIHFGCWWEYLRLTEKIHKTVFHSYTKLGYMLIGFGLMLLLCGPEYELSGYELKHSFSLPVSAAGFVMIIIGIFQNEPVRLKSFGAAALGLLYISLSNGLMVNIYKQTDIYVHDTMYILASNFIPLLIIISIWVNDTMAYIVGSIIGKTPLTKISPKKTWEGTIGGVMLSMAAIGFLFPLIFFQGIDFALVIFFILEAMIASITGTFGDLLESKLKRMANVKDSGSLMPGHGGFLDRFDSLLIAIPFVWLYVTFFIKL